MKKIISVILSVLMLSVLLITAVSAGDLQKGDAMPGTPKIDGEIDAVWADAPVYTIDRLKDGAATDMTAQFRALYDANNLYVLIEVKDADHSFNGGPSVGDGVEIYLDINNLKEEAYDDDAAVYFALSADMPDSPSFDGSSIGKVFLDTNEEVVVNETSDGYTYEMYINIAEFCGVTLDAGKTIGFDIQVNDQNNGDTVRTGAYGWNDDANAAWEHPSSFGELTMAAAAVEEAPAPEVTEAPAAEEPETEAPVTETPAVKEAPVTSAPQTSDVIFFTVIAITASAITAVTAKKHK